MKTPKDALDAITIASPCTVPWESMIGDEKKRYCGQCRLHVHDFSQMTRREIRTLLEETGGNCCKRIWRRPDGRMITKDCVRVVDAIRRRLRVVASAAAAIFAAVGLGGCGAARGADGDGKSTGGAAESDSWRCPFAPPKPPPAPTVSTGR